MLTHEVEDFERKLLTETGKDNIESLPRGVQYKRSCRSVHKPENFKQFT
jgi:hypothetical protein